MHRPERWGFLQFSEGEVNATETVLTEEWMVREVAIAIYYAQRQYWAANGEYSDDLVVLAELSEVCTLCPKDSVFN